MAAAAAASYPRYPSVAAPPFGGLGGIIPSPMVSASHPASARPMPGSHPSLAATSTPSSLASYPSYPGAHGALSHPASREKEDRETRRRDAVPGERRMKRRRTSRHTVGAQLPGERRKKRRYTAGVQPSVRAGDTPWRRRSSVRDGREVEAQGRPTQPS